MIRQKQPTNNYTSHYAKEEKNTKNSRKCLKSEIADMEIQNNTFILRCYQLNRFIVL